MKYRQFILAYACLIAACSVRHSANKAPRPDRAPLAPALDFAEAIGPRTLAVLVIDAQSGAPVQHSVVSISAERIGGAADTTGIVRLRLPRAGRFTVRVRGIGYEIWQGTASVSDSSGFALVVQLHRSYAPLIPVVVGPEPPARKPPDER